MLYKIKKLYAAVNTSAFGVLAQGLSCSFYGSVAVKLVKFRYWYTLLRRFLTKLVRIFFSPIHKMSLHEVEKLFLLLQIKLICYIFIRKNDVFLTILATFQ